MISDRPAEAADRQVPGHWEGDLIIGAHGRSAIGTLIERSTRYCLLLHLPARHGAEDVRDAMLAKIVELPEHLWRSLTWDQGIEMARHHEIGIASGLPSTSATLPALGNADPTRTPMACCANTSRLVWDRRWRDRICCP